MLSQVVLCCIISFCLLSSDVSCWNLSANSDRKAVIAIQAAPLLSSRGGKVVFTLLSLMFVSPKRCSSCPCPPSLPFFSFPIEILSATLLARYQVYRNALNLICEGHRMCAAYFLIICVNARCLQTVYSLAGGRSGRLKISPSYKLLCVRLCGCIVTVCISVCGLS